jgi:GPH family glycoside/pentoside/hexuronide:cation symporter
MGKAALAKKEHRISLKMKTVYGIGHIANNIKAVLFSIFSLYFYTTVLGLPGKLVGIAMAIGLVWDALIDPIIGMMSDHTSGRLGKRHGYMIIGSIGMGISFWAYFYPPPNLSQVGLFMWLLITSILVRTMTSIYSIAYYALGAEMCRDYHERSSITGIRGALALIGAMTAAALSFILFFPASVEGLDPKLNVRGYHAMGFAAGMVMTIAGLISTIGTLSYRRFADIGASSFAQKTFRIFFSNSLDAFKNRSFQIIFLSYAIFFFAIVINFTLATHFLTYYVKITDSKALSAYFFSFYAGSLLGIFFWMKAGRTIEKRWLYFLGTFSAAIIIGSAFYLLGEGTIFGTDNLPPLLIGHAIAGFLGSVLWMIPGSMIADVVDEDELTSGKRREGIFFGLFNLGEQIATGASLLIVGILIDSFAGLIPGQVSQSAMTVERIGILYCLLPAFLLLLAAILIFRYSLDLHHVNTIQRKLAEPKQKSDNY